MAAIIEETSIQVTDNKVTDSPYMHSSAGKRAHAQVAERGDLLSSKESVGATGNQVTARVLPMSHNSFYDSTMSKL